MIRTQTPPPAIEKVDEGAEDARPGHMQRLPMFDEQGDGEQWERIPSCEGGQKAGRGSRWMRSSRRSARPGGSPRGVCGSRDGDRCRTVTIALPSRTVESRKEYRRVKATLCAQTAARQGRRACSELLERATPTRAMKDCHTPFGVHTSLIGNAARSSLSPRTCLR